MSDEPAEMTKTASFRWLDGWSRIVLDMFAITFGVLLAFALNQWWTERTEADRVARAIAAIESELDRNHSYLERAIEYRMDLYPRILSWLDGEATFRDLEFRGTRPPSLERAAYDVAISTGALSDVDSETARTMVGAYLMLERVEGVHRMYSTGLPNLVFIADGQDDPRMAVYMQMAFQDFIYSEVAALNHIAELRGLEPQPRPWEMVATMRDERAARATEQAETTP